MSSFTTAFAAARKAGKKTFTWNGNRYNTKLAPASKVAKNVSVPGKRPAKDAKTATISKTSKAKAEYPKPMRAVGFAKARSGLSKIVARSENSATPSNATAMAKALLKTASSGKEVQGPKQEGVWYARKGSPMSRAAARRVNRPVSKANAATAFALGLMKMK